MYLDGRRPVNRPGATPPRNVVPSPILDAVTSVQQPSLTFPGSAHADPCRPTQTHTEQTAQQGRPATARQRPDDRSSRRPPAPRARTADHTPADQSAFAEVYEAYAGRIYRYLLSRTSSQSDAEELTSRTFLNAFAGLSRYRARRRGFSVWLMTIAHNLLVNWYRDRGRRPPMAPLEAAIDIPAETPGPESSLETNELNQRVREAIDELAPDRQQLITLKYVNGLSNAEIGRIMGRTEGAVKSLHHRTLRRLQGTLSDPSER